jgi:ferredoxin-thioredoxin reductase catalytic subunit
MTADELKATLAKIQEPKGYYFNHDSRQVADVLTELMENKKRYGYMSCPCRLANGDKAKDDDIICPCIYREADVAEYGICFCGLYVNREWNEKGRPAMAIPDRRPGSRIM